MGARRVLTVRRSTHSTVCSHVNQATHLRNGRPKEALAAFQSSLEALPWEADNFGYILCLRGQIQAFQELEYGAGILACLRLLIDLAGDLEEPYANLMSAIKEGSPDAEYAPLEKALTEDAEAVRQAAVGSVLGEPEAGDSGKLRD